VVGLALVSLGLAWRRRAALTAFVRERWRYLAGIEGLFLGLFLFDLTIRLANPDLWHPWMGGERPMDFAFFNAVVKAVYFPPAHPWFSGNYINYYYYGYVVAAIPTKLLGLVPATAFNLILPAWFALTGTGIFSVVYNLVSGPKQAISSSADELPPDGSNGASALVTPLSRRRGIETARLAMAAGGVAVALMLLLGNLYQVRQLYQYLPEIGAPSGLELNSFLDRAGAAVAGGLKVLSGSEKLPGDNARWFFSPSRPILHDGPDTPIAEFPLFTFLYADMHPHLLSMPALFAGLAWILAFLFRRGMPRRWPERIAVWFAAGIVFGFTRPAHTWDFPTLVGLAVLAIAWSEWRARPKLTRSLVLRVVGQIGLLVGLSIVFYAPFSRWFGTEYTSFELWKGARTPLGDYLTVHGLFLFCLVSYLLFESLPWLRGRLLVWRSRPAMYLLAGMRGWIPIAILAAIAVLLVLWASDYQVLAFGLPLLAWIAVLLLRRGQPLQKQVVLALAAAGVGVTLLVEVLVLKGDVGRSNMVFRYYLQAWAFFSVAAAAGLVGLLSTIAGWRRWIRFAWGTALVLLVLSAAAYPLTAIPRRVADRWPGIENPPHGLDGMAYMLGDTQENIPAIYDDEGRLLDLSSDYAGIRFMQDQVKGTPVIVEGNAPEYRWGARYSIYTGLPNVAGWNWHVRQHNSILDGALVERRIEEVNGFYNTTDMDAALRFLKRYRVAYVIVGGLEHGYYAAEGLAKFTGMVDTGSLEVSFTDGTDQGVTIYHVIP